MSLNVTLILGAIFAFIATIAAYIFVIPEKKRRSLNKFLRTLHDIFNFKSLLIESINKFFYVFTTLAVVFIGFFMLFTVVGGSSMFLYGLVYLLVSPFVVRIFFEFLMLFILLVKNTIDINKKLPGGKAAPRAPRAERRYAASRVPSENYDDTPDIGDIL